MQLISEDCSLIIKIRFAKTLGMKILIDFYYIQCPVKTNDLEN